MGRKRRMNSGKAEGQAAGPGEGMSLVVIVAVGQTRRLSIRAAESFPRVSLSEFGQEGATVQIHPPTA